MRFLAIVPLALLSMAAAAPRASPPPPGEIRLTPPAHCPDVAPRRADGQRLRVRRLDQLPPGDLSLTVMRQVGGCPQSTTIRQGFGAPAFGPGK